MTKSISKFIAGSVVGTALVFSLGLPSPASAQGRGVRHMQSLHRQETRQIGKDVRNGTLSRDQAKNLENHMSQLQASIAADKANGRLTPQELKNMKNETKKIEKAINGAGTPNPTMP